jgi:hypothetical protein
LEYRLEGMTMSISRGRNGLALLAIAACVAASACGESDKPLSIESVEPAVGSALGGETVIIRGSGLTQGVRVFFGTQEAAGVQILESGSVVAALTPTATAGVVDVIVENPEGDRAVAELAFEFLPVEVAYFDYTSRFPVDDGSSREGALVDVDRDGDLDAVISVRNRPNRLLVNDGNGNFSASTDFPEYDDATPLAEDTLALVPGDLDGDGAVDLYVANYSGQADRLYLNNGDGSFRDASDLLPPIATSSHGATFGDLDGDGDPDILVPVFGRNRIILNTSDLDPGLSLADASDLLPMDADNTTHMALGDLDVDGDLDIVVCNDQDATSTRMYINDGSGLFEVAEEGRLPSQTERCRWVLVADFSGDGAPDVITLNRTQNRFYLNDGGGYFFDDTIRVMPFDAAYSNSGAVVDLDLDGYFDLVIASYRVQNRLYMGQPDGTFRDYSHLLPPDTASSIDVLFGDVDGDADTDLIFTNGQSQQDLFYLLEPPTNGGT